MVRTVDELVAAWTRERTKHEAMAQLSAVGAPAGAVLDSMDLVIPSRNDGEV